MRAKLHDTLAKKEQMQRTVFLIDDDPDRLAVLTAQLERGRAFATKGFASAARALEAVATEAPDLVVCDAVLDGMDGVAFAEAARSLQPSLPVILIASPGRTDVMERALAAGVADFVTRPVEAATLLMRVKRALEEAPAQELLSTAARKAFDPHGIIGTHPLIQELRVFVENVAAVPHVSALLLGESGTGKNLVARAVHAAGGLPTYRFVEVNCAALPTNLLEAELFGYEKGAFTDATQTKKGLVEIADGGTLLLDEIGSLAPEMQAKLLTFLESRTFRRVGSTKEMKVALRVIAATNVDLAADVARGRFREDLFYRLNVASKTLPPLRMIRSDIPALAEHFVTRAAEYFRKPVPRLDAESVERLRRHDWPGNARELRNVIERALIFSRERVLRVPPPANPATADAGEIVRVPKGLTLAEVESLYIQATLDDVDGSISSAAERLGVTRKVLWSRRKRHGLLDEAEAAPSAGRDAPDV